MFCGGKIFPNLINVYNFSSIIIYDVNEIILKIFDYLIVKLLIVFLELV